MARRPNYGFEKRQKEIQRQKKKEEKAERKRMKKEEAAGGDQDEAVEGGADGGMPEGVASEEDIAELLGG